MASDLRISSTPWELSNTSPAERGPALIKSASGLYVATVITVPDARLMAAAPDLLAAVQTALWLMQRVSEWEESGEPITKYAAGKHGEQFRAAIAKARGEAVNAD